MNIHNYIKIAVLPVFFLMTSCYADLSTEADQVVPEIEITSESKTLNVYYGEEITLAPTISQEGRTAEDFEYEWKMDLVVGSAKNMIELGDGPVLEYTFANLPSSSPYSIILTVKDKITSLTKSYVWTVYVNSSLGEGILVAHTRDDGATTDFDLVADAPITYGYNGVEPRYTRNIYSLANDGPIKGVVNTVCQRVASDAAVFNCNDIIYGTDEGIFAIDPLTFKAGKKNSELFDLVNESSFATTGLLNFADYCHLAIVNGRFYGIVCNGSSNYTKTVYNVNGADNIKKNSYSYNKNDQGAVLHFNDVDRHFYSVRGWMLLNGSFSIAEAKDITFDLAQATCISSGMVHNGYHAAIMKDGSGNYHVLTFDLSGFDPAVTDYTLNAPEIEKAVSFGFCDNCDVIYYATDSKIYAIILSGGVANIRTLTWSPDDAGETITSISQYTQAWFGTQQLSFSNYEFTLPLHRLQVMITTYNETTKEGKIYLRPFNVNTGLFTYKTSGTYGGFGKIETTTTTLK